MRIAASAIAGRLARLRRDRRGGIAMLTAITLPVLLVLGCGAVELAGVRSDYSALQDAADAAALDAAKQLGVAQNSGIAARATQFVDAQAPEVVSRDAASVQTTFGANDGQVTVTVTGSRPSFFDNLLPPGGWGIHVSATAAAFGRVPLCVLSSGNANDIQMSGSSEVTAQNCLVQSNGDIAVADSAALDAGLVQAVGAASGSISPSPQTGAPAIDDPFASMPIRMNGLPLCNPLDLVYDIGVNVLSPGVHCGNITVRKQAVVQLLPGEHYFIGGHLRMLENSELTGSNVVLVFDDNSDFSFQDGAQINLQGRQGSSTYAGFVILTTRRNTGTFTISSDAARQLLGVIYIPNATLAVSGSGNRIADQSAWTVVVAKGIQMTGSPNLVINANYAGSTVPVPKGVGPQNAKVALVR